MESRIYARIAELDPVNDAPVGVFAIDSASFTGQIRVKADVFDLADGFTITDDEFFPI